MVHLAPKTSVPSLPTATPLCPTQSKQTYLSFQKDSARRFSQDRRSTITLGLVCVAVSLKALGDEQANAAGRRPPPPPPQERKDPNVSGIMAKILASKKRKEAMKDSMAKLREKGKEIQEPSN